MTVSIGGEIGEVGKENSTEEELRAYLDGYRRELDAAPVPDAIGISKVSVQTGTSHGGVPLPGGGVAEVKLDFGTLERLSESRANTASRAPSSTARRRCHDELFHRFPEVETAEIHLATGFQNALYEHPDFPADLLRQMSAWCFANTADERKEGETDDVFLYKTRKKALGPFKRAALGAADQGRDPRRARRRSSASSSRSCGSAALGHWSSGLCLRSDAISPCQSR